MPLHKISQRRNQLCLEESVEVSENLMRAWRCEDRFLFCDPKEQEYAIFGSAIPGSHTYISSGRTFFRKSKLYTASSYSMLGTKLSLSSRGRMTLAVGEIFWFISHTLPQCHALQGVGDTYL
jgi:hypothetical protein